MEQKQIEEFARTGIKLELERLDTAASKLRTLLGELMAKPTRAKRTIKTVSARPPRTAAQRKQISMRMKRYWRARRKAER